MPTINQLVRKPRVQQYRRPKHPALHGCPQKKGVCLQALQDVELVFPGILVEGSEQFGQVIEVSDPKTEVGIVNNRNGEGFEPIGPA